MCTYWVFLSRAEGTAGLRQGRFTNRCAREWVEMQRRTEKVKTRALMKQKRILNTFSQFRQQREQKTILELFFCFHWFVHFWHRIKKGRKLHDALVRAVSTITRAGPQDNVLGTGIFQFSLHSFYKWWMFDFSTYSLLLIIRVLFVPVERYRRK